MSVFIVSMSVFIVSILVFISVNFVNTVLKSATVVGDSPPPLRSAVAVVVPVVPEEFSSLWSCVVEDDMVFAFFLCGDGYVFCTTTTTVVIQIDVAK
jgi:hypothetical protein